ncbi:MAG: GNAT family protein [Patescibacteria group bacterium]
MDPVGYTGLFVRQRHRIGILRYAIGDSTHENKGIATKAVNLMTKWAFDDLDLVSIHASVISSNVGSIRVLKKSGFSQVGKYQKARFESGQHYDEILFELLRKGTTI